MSTEDVRTRLSEALDEAEKLAKAASKKVAEHVYPPAWVDGDYQPEGEVEGDALVEVSGHWSADVYLFGKAVRADARPGWERWSILTGQPPIADFVARWDPSTVLRLVERDRQLLDLLAAAEALDAERMQNAQPLTVDGMTQAAVEVATMESLRSPNVAADLYGRGHPPMTWWQRWTHRRGKHNWRHLADRVWCEGCGKWWGE